MQHLTSEITEATKQHNEMHQQTMGLSNATQHQDLTPQPQQEKRQEEEKTQGDYEQEIYDLNTKLDKYQENYNWINNLNLEKISNNNNSKLIDILSKMPEKYYQNYVKNGIPKATYNFKTNGYDYDQTMINEIKDYYNKEMGNIRNQIATIKDNTKTPGYDDRTPEQKREDDSYQRAVEDMREAGLHPGLMFGGGVGGGSSGGSKSDEDEEKRKRKRREELELERAKAQEQQRIMSALMGTMGVALMGGLSMQQANARNQANIQSREAISKNRIDSQQLIAKNRNQTNMRRDEMKELWKRRRYGEYQDY